MDQRKKFIFIVDYGSVWYYLTNVNEGKKH